jgi:hypothetical protein
MSGTAKALLKRRIAASIEDVFEACTRPDLLAQWFGPKDFKTCEVEADMRIGGRFAFRMTGRPVPVLLKGLSRDRATDPDRFDMVLDGRAARRAAGRNHLARYVRARIGWGWHHTDAHP